MTDDDIIKQRVAAHHCFYGMECSEDRNKIADWAPLIMDGWDNKEPFAATRIITGSDVYYGALTHLLIKHPSDRPRDDACRAGAAERAIAVFGMVADMSHGFPASSRGGRSRHGCYLHVIKSLRAYK